MTNDQAPMTNEGTSVDHAIGFLPTDRLRKRLLKGLAALAAITFTVAEVMSGSAEAQLESRLAVMRAAGDPASIADLAPASIPDDENAALILDRIGPRLSEFSRDYARFFDTPIGQSYEQAQDRGELPTPEQLFEIRLILIKYEDIDQALFQAGKCDRYASRLDYARLFTDFVDEAVKTQGGIRTAARFVNWRMEVLNSDGFYDDALEYGLRILKLARLYESEPTIVPFLVGISVRSLTVPHIYDALSADFISEQLHVSLDKELSVVDTPQRLVRTLKSERAVSADWVSEYLLLHSIVPEACQWVLKSEQLGLLDEIDAYLQLTEVPWHEARDRLAPPDTILPLSKRGKLADSLLPGLQATFHANARSLAVMRSLRVYNALRQFAENNDREAKGLAELGLPQADTIDPYSGQPLRLKLTDEGWLVYSVMDNGVDDGGDFMGRKDYGVGPPKLRLTE